jgi:hypothetical protein
MCNRTGNVDALFFMLGWTRCGLHKKCAGIHYTKFVIFHLVRSMGHIVHYGASGPRNVDGLFFMLGGPSAVSRKSATRHVIPNLCFCIWWDLRVKQCIPVRLGHETLTHYFSCFGEPDTDLTKSASGQATPYLYFCIWWDLQDM